MPKIKQLSETERWQLAWLLRRIENGIDVQTNIDRLWHFCKQAAVDFDYLQKFMQKCLLHYDSTLQRLAASLDTSIEGRLNSEKIAFIMCVNDEAAFDEAVLYLQHLYVPEGMEAEIIPIRGATSMCGGYEQGRQASDAKYKVYLHQDVQVIRKNIVDELLAVFRNPGVGVIGLAGCEKLPPHGIWWNGEGTHNMVAHALWPEHIGMVDKMVPYCQVQAADGVFLATQYDIPWRQDLLKGWHFYDIAQCLDYRHQGYEVVLPRQDEPWIIHQTQHTKVGEDYYREQEIFLQTYAPFC